MRYLFLIKISQSDFDSNIAQAAFILRAFITELTDYKPNHPSDFGRAMAAHDFYLFLGWPWYVPHRKAKKVVSMVLITFFGIAYTDSVYTGILQSTLSIKTIFPPMDSSLQLHPPIFVLIFSSNFEK